MNKLKIYSVTLLALGLLFFNACSEDEGTDPVTPTPTPTSTTYTADVAPILNASCAFTGCHNSGSGVGSLANYADAKVFTEVGRLVPAIKHADGYSPMPKNGTKMSDANIAIFEKWITDGYKE